jgi:hypothetical protein
MLRTRFRFLIGLCLLTLSPSGRAAGPEPHCANRVIIFPDTLLIVRTRINPSLRLSIWHGGVSDLRLSNAVGDAVVGRLREEGRNWTIRSSSAIDNGRNIVVDQLLTLNRQGSPYRIAVSARQGGTRWTRSITRPHAVQILGGVPIRQGRKLIDGSPYWDPFFDSADLGKQLAQALCIPGPPRPE